MLVESVSVYPLKSGRGVQVGTVDVEPAGLVDDRRWAVVQGDGAVVTARQNDRLLLVAASHDHGQLTLAASDVPPLLVPTPTGGDRIQVGVSRMPQAIDAGSEPANWLSEVLGETVRLVWQDDTRSRTVSAEHGGLGGDPLNLADAGPVLLTTSASLARLNEWIAESEPTARVPMERFRPNVVVSGSSDPFEEDGWRRIRIGDLEYRFAETCDRCVMTTIDPTTLTHGREPIRTLARHRRWNGKTWFGVRLVPLGTGAVQVGDDVTVLERA